MKLEHKYLFNFKYSTSHIYVEISNKKIILGSDKNGIGRFSYFTLENTHKDIIDILGEDVKISHFIFYKNPELAKSLYNYYIVNKRNSIINELI